jgi:hypothetical protein
MANRPAIKAAPDLDERGQSPSTAAFRCAGAFSQ